MGMLKKDYIVDQFVRFAEAIRIGVDRASGPGKDKGEACDTIEAQIGESVNIEGQALLALAPASVTSILQVSDTDPALVEYIVRSLLLESELLEQMGKQQLATLRGQQADSLAGAYGIDLSESLLDPDELEAFFKQSLDAVKDE